MISIMTVYDISLFEERIENENKPQYDLIYIICIAKNYICYI